MVFSSFYHGQPLFPKWFCDRKLSFCDGSAETSVFYSCFFCGGKFRLSVCRAMNPLFDAALCGSTPIHHTPDSYANANLSGRAPPSCCARPFGRLKAPLGLLLLRCAVQTRTFENTPLSAACKKKKWKLWQKERGPDGASPLDKVLSYVSSPMGLHFRPCVHR